jgi:hypothetical protein
MRRLRRLWLVCVLVPVSVQAGQIYGSVIENGRALPNAAIRINCQAGGSAESQTAGDGSFRVNVAGEGRCTFTLTQYGASATVFSNVRPTQYDFELRRQGGTAQLLIR